MGRKRQEVGGHAAGGGILRILQQLLHFLPLLRLHLFQNPFRGSAGQLAQQVGGGIGMHLFHDAGGALGIHPLHHRHLHFAVDFLQRLRRHFFVQALEYRPALGRAQFFQDVGDVGRMQAREPGMLNAQLHPAGGIGLDQVHEFPGNDARRDLGQQHVQRHGGHHSRQQSAHRSPRAYIHPGHLQRDVLIHRHRIEVHIVYPHHLAAVDVDDLLVQQVAAQQQKSFRLAGIEWHPLRGAGGRLQFAAFDARDVFPAQQPVALRRAHDKRRHLSWIFLGKQRQLAHPSAHRAGNIYHPRAQQLGERKIRHRPQNTAAMRAYQ